MVTLIFFALPSFFTSDFLNFSFALPLPAVFSVVLPLAIVTGFVPFLISLSFFAVLASTVAVSDRAPGAGTLVLKAQLDAKTAKKLKLIKKGTKPVSVASGKATAKGAGSSTAKLKFTKTAAKRLKKAKSLKLKLVGTFTPAGGGAAQAVSATVTITK